MPIPYEQPRRIADADPAPTGDGNELDWQTLGGLPVFTEFYHLIRRLFGIDIALISPDGRQGCMLGRGREFNPFCRAMQRRPEGIARCKACDMEYAEKAVRLNKPLRYTCHAGLTEFIIPIDVEGRVVALLQCGQVLDHEPAPADWQRVKKRLDWVTDGTRDLARALRRTPSLSRTTQKDLIALLTLIAQQAATAHHQAKLLGQSRQNQVVSRALQFLEQNFLDEVSLDDVASAAYTSRRNLTRLLSTHTGATVVDHLHRLRVKCACDLLQRSDAAIIEVALAAGFGSLPQFNRIFRKRTGKSPSAYSKACLNTPPGNRSPFMAQ